MLGVALGVAMAATELDGWRSFQRLADLFQAAGADRRVAEAEFAWHRDSRSRFRARR